MERGGGSRDAAPASDAPVASDPSAAPQPPVASDPSAAPQPAGRPEEALPYGPRMSRMLPRMHRWFLFLNRWFGVPLIKAGLSPAWGTPYGGYFVLLRTRGRKSGEMREAPLGYGLADGNVYVMAGFGRRTQWLRNIEADPNVEVILPGRALRGLAEEVTDPAERARGMRAAAIGCGLVGAATLRLDPRRASDEALLLATAGIPLVRVRPTGIAAGPWDPGGRGWATLAAAWGIVAVRWIRGPRRGRPR